jgi:phage terminase large subunit GpA-like protein
MEIIIIPDSIDYRLIGGFISGLKPTPLLTCSQWADANRFLSSVAAAEPGRWRTSRTPFLKAILDALSPTSQYKHVIVKKAVQLGFTESGLNAVGTYIDIAPCPILYIMPTVNMAKGFSKTRVEPMIDACPTLRIKIPQKRERDGGNTLLEKEYPGGVLVLTGANSAAELRSRPIRVLVMDEIDAYPMNVDDEGSPIELAEKRTVTFSNRKIYKLSTPTVAGASAIDIEIDQTDKRKYFVPLPCCPDVPQTLEFENLVWEKGKPETVKYKCEHCGELNEERFKPKFLEAGEWRPLDPEKSSKDVIGFIINGLYSPLGWLSWVDIAREYDKALDDTSGIKMRTFVNTIKGESYAETTNKPDWELLYNRRENYPEEYVSKEVAFITAGVDVQKDRIEIEIVGWCKGKITYSIEYKVIYGDTSEYNTGVWDQLAAFINKQYLREDKALLPIRTVAIDTGYNNNQVYEFCRRFDYSKVLPVKGSETRTTVIGTPTTVDINIEGKKTGTIKLWHIGVSIVKTEIYSWLRATIKKNDKGEDVVPDGYCHFPQYGQEYFKGITAEELQYKLVRGYKKYEWVKRYDRNEPLDCRVYARAAAAVLGVDRLTNEQWEELRNGYLVASEEQKQPRRKSSFWD